MCDGVCVCVCVCVCAYMYLILCLQSAMLLKAFSKLNSDLFFSSAHCLMLTLHLNKRGKFIILVMELTTKKAPTSSISCLFLSSCEWCSSYKRRSSSTVPIT